MASPDESLKASEKSSASPSYVHFQSKNAVLFSVSYHWCLVWGTCGGGVQPLATSSGAASVSCHEVFVETVFVETPTAATATRASAAMARGQELDVLF
mmetsp:Transcript_32951/g.102143  ORF Transcript_32951/g.102143 Transcript_32951/m.102143 type:complete len:98 (+) Transcript_32951:882-1175(+)